MRGIAVVGALVLAIASSASPARADKILIERVESRASVLPGQTRVRALITATETGGEVVEAPLDEKSKSTTLKLHAGSSSPPFLIGAFEHAEVELTLVIAIPTTIEWEQDFELIKEAIDAELFEPLVGMGSRARVQVIGYGYDLTGSKGVLRAADARKEFARLDFDGSSEEVDLADVVRRCVSSAGRYVKRPRDKAALPRAAVVLVSNGIARVDDDIKKAITDVGKEADAAGVRIHTLGYSPSPDGKYRPVRPLLALGELSLQSKGTFRWIKTDGGMHAAVAQLAREITREHVVTFFAPAGELDRKKLTASVPLGSGSLNADGVLIMPPTCGGRDVCDARSYCVESACVARSIERPGVLGKVLLFGGIGVGGLVVLVGVMTLVTRRRGVSAVPPPGTYPMPGAPPGAPMGVVGHAPMPGVPGPAAGVPGMPGMPGAPAAVPQAPPGGPVLIVLGGPAAGTRLPLRHGFNVGKAPGSDLDLSHDGFASSHHAQILNEGGAWIVYDRDSTNGTFANGVRITQQRLDHGMSIRFGSTDVRFWVG